MEPVIQKDVDPFIDGHGPVQQGTDRESWKAMAQGVYGDIVHLIEKEGQLIRVEMSEKLTDVRTAGVNAGIGGVLLHTGALCLAATCIILLAQVMNLWIASAVVTFVFLVIGAFLLMAAKKKLEGENLKPNRSLAAFGEIRHTLKEKVNEITKH